jgi:hypothetical protein
MSARGIDMSHWPASRIVFAGLGAGFTIALSWLVVLVIAAMILRVQGHCS